MFLFILLSFHCSFPIQFLNTPIFTSVSTDKNSRKQEAEWKEKAKVELEDWHARQNEQLEKTKTNNRYWFCRSFATRIQARKGNRGNIG